MSYNGILQILRDDFIKLMISVVKGEIMKHIFVVNPNAGKGRAEEIVRGQVALVENEIDCEIYITKGKNDAERFIKDYLTNHSEPTRFYACGGDGTINETVNGIAEFENASFTVFPCGSGNDFVKTFGKGEDFLNIKELVYGTEVEIDVLKVNDRYCINVLHFGFDTCVAQTMDNVRSKPLIGGKNAYTTGVVTAVIKAMKNKATIIADGEKMNDGLFLLCTLANGQYVGGKFRCAPRAVVNDGMLELCLVEPVSRFTFIRLVGAYAEGKHLDDPRFSEFVHYKRCKRVEILGNEKTKISIDGEVRISPHTITEVIPNALRLALPNVLLKDFYKRMETYKLNG